MVARAEPQIFTAEVFASATKYDFEGKMDVKSIPVPEGWTYFTHRAQPTKRLHHDGRVQVDFLRDPANHSRIIEVSVTARAHGFRNEKGERLPQHIGAKLIVKVIPLPQ